MLSRSLLNFKYISVCVSKDPRISLGRPRGRPRPLPLPLTSVERHLLSICSLLIPLPLPRGRPRPLPRPLTFRSLALFDNSANLSASQFTISSMTIFNCLSKIVSDGSVTEGFLFTLGSVTFLDILLVEQFESSYLHESICIDLHFSCFLSTGTSFAAFP
ncbi:hypothetical protein MRV_0100 [Murid herpesvirus 3]|uniref:Uncharacterized protein n=2 Tax=Murid betaherpesvirus 3 TaxID=2560603 RepID=A0A1P8VIZ5_9BETA|nr:hypothetical protein MRV_0100 [Murine roseolovirus]APZ76311.1 hypothetical protein MRV_0100 [Murid betaherpesvirus 3]AYH64797.1 hypothetical protein MRV_0100 [Murid herpesvirus 3]